VPSEIETVVIVGLRTLDQSPDFYEESMVELSRLVYSAGGKVISRLDQTREKPVPATFIGKGKLDELTELVQSDNCHTVVFDDDLKPVQLRNIETALGGETKVIDRSALILDIFASRARTAEAKIQVELAQLEYMRPRLAGLWPHLSRQYGGSIGARGPGETQLETDRRVVDRRIAGLKRKLVKIERQRKTRMKRRRGMFRVSLLGYTNAGKSTLLNALTNSKAFAGDKLFATLDPRTRSYCDPWGRRLLFTDTVGFIRKLPHHLVESFRSTLSEAGESDLILIVADASHPAIEDHLDVVHSELERMEIDDRQRILLLNKSDLIDEFTRIALSRKYPHGRFISASEGEGLVELMEEILSRVPAGDWAGEFVEPVKDSIRE